MKLGATSDETSEAREASDCGRPVESCSNGNASIISSFPISEGGGGSVHLAGLLLVATSDEAPEALRASDCARPVDSCSKGNTSIVSSFSSSGDDALVGPAGLIPGDSSDEASEALVNKGLTLLTLSGLATGSYCGRRDMAGRSIGPVERGAG